MRAAGTALTSWLTRSDALPWACILATALPLGAACESRAPKGERALPTETRERSPASNPALHVLIAVDLEGVLEPCGCTSRPAGGLDRLAAALQGLRERNQPSLSFLAGNIFAARGDAGSAAESVQATWKQEALVAVLAQLGVSAVAPSSAEFERAHGPLAQLVHAGKLQILGEDNGHGLSHVTRSLLLRAGPHTLGALSVAASAASGAPAPVVLAALRSRSDALRTAGAEWVLLFVCGTLTLAEELARESGVDVVIHTGSAAAEGGLRRVAVRAQDTPAPANRPKSALLLTGGRHGEALWQLDLRPAPSLAAARYLELDHTAPRDPDVRRVLDQLFARLSSAQPPNEDLTQNAPNAKRGPDYVGAQTCAACHTQAYFAWRGTRHGRAYETLKARGRELDLECVSCHVTGFGQPGGATLASLQHLEGVGCESCHGPGGAHVDNPNSRAGHLPRAVPERACLSCHDAEHSDHFDYVVAQPRLLVPGHGRAVGSP